MSESVPDSGPTAPKFTERRIYLRHLGHAVAVVVRETDALRSGIAVTLDTICVEGVGITSPTPLNLGERVKITLRNDIQRFKKELRGQVRWIEPVGNKFRVGMSLATRLMPLDLMVLKRAGAAEQGVSGRVWV